MQIAALDFLAETIQMLIEEPGKFEQSQKELNALYIEFAQDNYVMSNAIEMLFEHVSILYLRVMLGLHFYDKHVVSNN